MPEGIKPGRFERASVDANLYAINEALEDLIAGGGGGGGGAPTDAEYITGSSDPTLTNERVLTNTATVTWDLSTAGQVKANATATVTADQMYAHDFLLMGAGRGDCLQDARPICSVGNHGDDAVYRPWFDLCGGGNGRLLQSWLDGDDVSDQRCGWRWRDCE